MASNNVMLTAMNVCIYRPINNKSCQQKKNVTSRSLKCRVTCEQDMLCVQSHWRGRQQRTAQRKAAPQAAAAQAAFSQETTGACSRMSRNLAIAVHSLGQVSTIGDE
jgi:hypothetical protein